jgi:hypothetical protein
VFQAAEDAESSAQVAISAPVMRALYKSMFASVLFEKLALNFHGRLKFIAFHALTYALLVRDDPNRLSPSHLTSPSYPSSQ